MFLSQVPITPQSYVKEIVLGDHRTVDVFRNYGIEYCCGARWSLETVCMMKGLEIDKLLSELQYATRPLALPNTVAFDEWSTDFLVEYIVNVHHHFLKKFIPATSPVLAHFIDEHRKKDPRLTEVENCYSRLEMELIPHLLEEEEVIFPYIRQLAHAFDGRDQYARLLVKTLRKPVDVLMHKEHEIMVDHLGRLRMLTDNYTPPEKACTSHHVVLGKLRQLDNDLSQHLHLENNILFPRAINMEKELLSA